jgi:exodeoxyribonuclease VIII
MENADYHRHKAVSKSHLDQIAKSPLHYWGKYLDPNRKPFEETPAMALGTAVHTAVLEPDELQNRYALAPDVDRRTKAGKEEWSAAVAGGRKLLKWEEFDQVNAMATSVRNHPAAAFLFSRPGKAETSWMWNDDVTGAECKCRPDWLTNDHRLLVDLKTTKDASLREFKRSIANFRYFVQAGWYLHGIEKAGSQRPEQFIFVCVESSAPYACAVYAADAEMIKVGWDTARRDLDKLIECRKTDQWPGYSTQIEPIGLPGWMVPGQQQNTLPEIEMY